MSESGFPGPGLPSIPQEVLRFAARVVAQTFRPGQYIHVLSAHDRHFFR